MDREKNFIREHFNEDPAKLSLKYGGKKDLDYKSLIKEIEVRQRLSKKAPNWANNLNLKMPEKLNIEQCSSWQTAAYKQQFAKGKTGADLTGGFGIDAFHLAKGFEEFHYCEINANLADIVNHNFSALNNHVNIHHQNGLDWLNKTSKKIDFIFLDPARRDARKNKVFFLDDCEPNVLEHLPLLFEKGENILIKTSPLLDLTASINALKFVSRIDIVSLQGEIKELLFHLHKNADPKEINLHCVEIIGDGTYTEWVTPHIDSAEVSLAKATKKILLEPQLSILKAGKWNALGASFSLEKLHPQTHLFFSDEPVKDFPGNQYEIIEIYGLKEGKKLPKKANVKVRNFPLKGPEILKKYKITPHNSIYIFAVTTTPNKPQFFICKRK